MANDQIKRAAKEKNVHLWKIAYTLGYTDSYFSKLLRKEFPDEKRSEILAIIDNISVQEG